MILLVLLKDFTVCLTKNSKNNMPIVECPDGAPYYF